MIFLESRDRVVLFSSHTVCRIPLSLSRDLHPEICYCYWVVFGSHAWLVVAIVMVHTNCISTSSPGQSNLAIDNRASSSKDSWWGPSPGPWPLRHDRWSHLNCYCSSDCHLPRGRWSIFAPKRQLIGGLVKPVEPEFKSIFIILFFAPCQQKKTHLSQSQQQANQFSLWQPGWDDVFFAAVDLNLATGKLVCSWWLVGRLWVYKLRVNLRWWLPTWLLHVALLLLLLHARQNTTKRLQNGYKTASSFYFRKFCFASSSSLFLLILHVTTKLENYTPGCNATLLLHAPIHRKLHALEILHNLIFFSSLFCSKLPKHKLFFFVAPSWKNAHFNITSQQHSPLKNSHKTQSPGLA